MRRLISTAALAGAIALGGVAVPAAAVNIGNEGCTPGYWKNHTENWQEATTDTVVGSLYEKATTTASVKLPAALALRGGSGPAGAERILIRAAVAAWLNSAHEGLGFPWRRFSNGLDGRPALVATVNAELMSGNRSTMLALATRLDGDNNLGCPLS